MTITSDSRGTGFEFLPGGYGWVLSRPILNNTAYDPDKAFRINGTSVSFSRGDEIRWILSDEQGEW